MGVSDNGDEGECERWAFSCIGHCRVIDACVRRICMRYRFCEEEPVTISKFLVLSDQQLDSVAVSELDTPAYGGLELSGSM